MPTDVFLYFFPVWTWPPGNTTDRETFSESCQTEPNLGCNCTFPIDLGNQSKIIFTIDRESVTTIQIWFWFNNSQKIFIFVCTTVRRTAVGETGVSRYHEGWIESPFETPRNIATLWYWGLWGAILNYGKRRQPMQIFPVWDIGRLFSDWKVFPLGIMGG